MKYTILIIEDNPEILDNIAEILSLAGYSVLKALGGKAGVELAQYHHPDLILCDVMMPDLDGYGVLHILNKNPELAAIPFIFLTALTEHEHVREGMSLGADDYVTKPFDGSELLKVIETRLRKREFIRSSLATSGVNTLDDFFLAARQQRGFQQLSEHRHLRKLKKKDFLFMEGQEPNDLFFIHKGEIKTYKTTREGKELITGVHKAGSFIGYLPMFDNTPYSETAVALTDTEVYLIPKDDFNTLVFSSQDMAIRFIRLLANNLEDMEKRLLAMAYQSVRQRVASTLLRLSETAGDPLLITMSRKDISCLVGTAIESLNRMLADFRDEGLVDLTDHGIRLIDKLRLERATR
jgi:CRP-like cAMP-binding protein/ActR/RegA family two-component response regulator